MKDSWEILAGYNPLDANPDNDTYKDKEEYDNEIDPDQYDKGWYEHVKGILAGAACGSYVTDMANSIGRLSEYLYRQRGT